MATTIGRIDAVPEVAHHDADAAAARQVLAGDVDAFERIVERWQGPLVNLAYRYCRNRGEAEELAQEAFLKIFRGLGKWRQEGRFSTWLYAVASNHYRSALRRTQPDGVDLERIAQFVAAGDHAGEMDQASRDEAVRRAVASLPSKYRDVTILYYFNEMDISETGRITGLKEGTVKARLYRARQMLESKLGDLLSGPETAEATT